MSDGVQRLTLATYPCIPSQGCCSEVVVDNWLSLELAKAKSQQSAAVDIGGRSGLSETLTRAPTNIGT